LFFLNVQLSSSRDSNKLKKTEMGFFFQKNILPLWLSTFIGKFYGLSGKKISSPFMNFQLATKRVVTTAFWQLRCWEGGKVKINGVWSPISVSGDRRRPMQLRGCKLTPHYNLGFLRPQFLAENSKIIEWKCIFFCQKLIDGKNSKKWMLKIIFQTFKFTTLKNRQITHG